MQACVGISVCECVGVLQSVCVNVAKAIVVAIVVVKQKVETLKNYF